MPYTTLPRTRLVGTVLTVGQEKFITLAGSEPLLAEAAYELRNGTLSNLNLVHQLVNHSDLNCVNHGQREELVATLLITACKRATPHSRHWEASEATEGPYVH